MEGVWRKAKKAMGVGLCVHLPAVAGDREGGASERRASDAVSLDSAAAAHASAPNTPAATATAEASGTRALRRSKSGGKSSKVRPFLPLHCPSKSLSRHSELRFALGAPATWHARGGGSLAEMRDVAGTEAGLPPVWVVFGWSWVWIGAMWLRP